ncbi:AEC family transporter [Orrella sp. NBD-18]|uniref:AEC family transporter n=1 Tax=Sheuella amnicola TaxID=2707330 RepID=A0A6B2QY83_9BURK|nr:AEC family transporter [Sheuella amnicola]
MAPVIDAVFPIFALILTGWLCARFKLLSALSMEGLNKFVIYLALPSQLFYAMAHARLTDLAQPGFFLSFGISIFTTAGVQAYLSRHSPQHPVDRMIDCMTSGYSNCGFMGIPLCLMIFGSASLGPSIIATLFTVSLLFAVTIAFIELQRNRDGNVLKTLLKILAAMLRNPLLIAPLLGVAISASPWSLPVSVDRYFNLLGEAATPCALISIGLFLAQSSKSVAGDGVYRIVALKLILQPLIAAFCVLFIFDMPSMWALIAILMAALPVGTGPFMMANLYARDASSSARAILLSTVLSVMTISALTAWVTSRIE